MGLRLNLGAGIREEPGYEPVDLYAPGAQKVDLHMFPWPWDDGEVEAVWCSHYIEHQPRALWVAFVDELWRILEMGGTATIIHPNLQSARAFQDPFHEDFLPVDRWQYVNRAWRDENLLVSPPYPTCNFAYTIGAAFNDERVGARTEEALMDAAKYEWNVVLDLMVQLTKVE